MRTRGFTIIELLIAVGIIAILSSFILVATGDIRERSRDSKRIQDLKQISNALNLYYTSYARFPIVTSSTTITSTDALSVELEGEALIPNVETDPLHPAQVYQYRSSSTGSNYWISFCLETSAIQQYSQGCGNTITP